jgi:hypothetical protein
MSRYILFEKAHVREPTILSRNAVTIRLHLPTFIAIRPEGSSMKALEKKNAEVTKPTKIPAGSSTGLSANSILGLFAD